MTHRGKDRGAALKLDLPVGSVSSERVRNTSRSRVLVVEDNADTRTLVDLLLRKTFDVHCAADADEGLRMASASNFDVILVDINLGKGKTGRDVLDAVKSLPSYSDTPVIAVTAYALPGDRERFVSEGFDEYVAKPFTRKRLIEALESVLA